MSEVPGEVVTAVAKAADDFYEPVSLAESLCMDDKERDARLIRSVLAALRADPALAAAALGGQVRWETRGGSFYFKDGEFHESKTYRHGRALGPWTEVTP